MSPTAPKKTETQKKAAASSWITQGREELKAQTPAQRGIVVEKPSSPEEKRPKAKRERFTVNLTPDLINWARKAVIFTPGQSLTGLMEEALTRELERLEKKRGEPFPDTTATPKKGRPLTIKE
jgi:hypothetical protein